MRRVLALALAAATSTAAVTTAVADTAQPPRPVVSAHRGGAAYAPENTMTAFRNAVRLGVDQLETDTQLTKDGKLVLIHDHSLDRTTSCTGSVQDKTYADIARCDAAWWFTPGQGTTSPDPAAWHPLRGKGVRVPLAQELFDYVRSLRHRAPTISIEIKDLPGEANFDPSGTKVAAVLVPLIQRSGLKQRTIVQSFWPAALDEVKRLDPSIRTQFLTAAPETATAGLTYTVSRGHDITAPDFTSPDFGPSFVSVAHGAGKQVIPWTADKKADQATVIAAGVDGVISNWPACTLLLEDRHAPAPGYRLPACPLDPTPHYVAQHERPSRDTCWVLHPKRWAPPAARFDKRGNLRVVGIQFKQDVRYVESYASFRTKMRCLVEEFVVPNERRGVPTIAVFNEDIGLMTLATGRRGAAVRAQAATPLRAPVTDQGPAPAGAAAALGAMNAAYAPQVAAYQSMFGPIDARKQVFVAATDTFVRAFSQTFSDIARDYGIYVVASNNMADYRETHDPAEVARFGDPDLQPGLDTAYVATSQHVANKTFLWGPKDVHPKAANGKTNLLFTNEKVPLTDIEKSLLALDEGPATGKAARANAAGYVVAGHRLGFATSLPAFAWGYPFGKRPRDLQPCQDVRLTYMPCMDSLGVDTVIQAEANPGRWAGNGGGGYWQPLEWMGSTWRTVADPTVRFRYNVTPMMVGNLLDLAFDGQSAITMRGFRGPRRHYVGDRTTDARDGDPSYASVLAGGKPEFLALAPWVVSDASRQALRAEGARLAPGSDDPEENNYLETAVVADLLPR